MEIKGHNRTKSGAGLRGSVLLASLFVLSACNAHSMLELNDEFATAQKPVIEIEAPVDWQEDGLDILKTEWQDCLSDGRKLDGLAGKQVQVGRYLNAAQILKSCDQKLTEDMTLDFNRKDRETRMQHLGLSVLNFIKAGDLNSATAQLKRMQNHFRGHDLYLEDGSSLLEALDQLIARNSENRLANIAEPLRQELARVRYWEDH